MGAQGGQNVREPLERTTRGYPGRPRPWLAGVASGLAVHLNVPAKAIRWLAVLLTPLGAPLLYIWLWIFTPKVSSERKYKLPRIARPVREIGEGTSSNAKKGLAIAIVLLLSAAVVLAAQMQLIILTTEWVGVVLAIVGVVLIWIQANGVKHWKTPAFLGGTAAGILFLLAGVTLFLLGGETELFAGLILGLALILMLALAFSPLLLRMTKELSASEVARARETERADIAAHLHDSVLQTLTLIKNNADNPASVRTLALKQERELRSWLYTGTTQTSDSVKRLLETSIEAVEQTYGKEAETVTVGDAVPGPSEQAAIAAAVEAVKNAMRHGKPPIQVYAELGDNYEVFIKDSGPGFDLAEVPEDRHGVRDSIIARVERVGGRARIRTLNPGTEIHICVPRSDMEKQ
ncbi:MAG: PspC domain-containing protein [Actinomycetaceae bacterium]|nr:PspC domain-containing protein [Actinomycetaceae bacterium]